MTPPNMGEYPLDGGDPVGGHPGGHPGGHGGYEHHPHVHDPHMPRDLVVSSHLGQCSPVSLHSHQQQQQHSPPMMSPHHMHAMQNH